MQKTAPYSLSEVERALERSEKVRPFRGLLFIFWGVLVAKCLFLQWAIFTYHVPIDGWLFVWTPSFLFGVLCMFVYARSALGDFSRTPMTTRLVRGLWMACGAAFLIFAAESLFFGGFNPYLLPGTFAVLIGVGFFIEGVSEGNRFNQALGITWWCAAFLLFAVRGVNALAILGGQILVLQVLPSTVQFMKQRKSNTVLTQALEI